MHAYIDKEASLKGRLVGLTKKIKMSGPGGQKRIRARIDSARERGLKRVENNSTKRIMPDFKKIEKETPSELHKPLKDRYIDTIEGPKFKKSLDRVYRRTNIMQSKASMI